MALDLSLQGVHTFFSSHNGRDQFGKLVQYATRGMVGALTDLINDLPKDSPRRADFEVKRQFYRRIMVAVGDARRTVRWLASLGIIIALKKLAETGACPWTNKPAFVASQLALLWWHFGDNYRWLVLNQLVEGDATKLKNVSFTGFVISSLISSAYFSHKLISPPPGLLADVQKERETQRNLVKSVLTLIATLHISELYPTHEVICGAAGAVTAAIVIWETFPKKQSDKKQ